MDRNKLRQKLMKKTQTEIAENLAGKEVHIIKAVKLISDLDVVTNLLKENVVDWEKRNPGENATKMLEKLKANQSVLENEKKELSEFIEAEMSEELPVFASVAGAVLGARILAQAGSKKRLAFLPSSTVQLLGAEKALFNHLKKQGSCPKHGHIFNHPLIQKLPKQKRGKAARILAGKLSIAAKLDYFGNKSETDLLKDAETKIAKL
jgi:nucleolar protein 56